MRSASLLLLLVLNVVAPAWSQELPLDVAPRADVEREVERAIAWVNGPGFDASVAGRLSAASERWAALDPFQVDATEPGSVERVLRRLFDLMLALDDRCAALAEASLLGDELAHAKRRALRTVRLLREQLLLRLASLDPARLSAIERPALGRRWARQTWTAAPAWRGTRPEELPRTCVILCTGTSSVSAAIARSSALENVFSHLALAYRCDRPVDVRGRAYPAGTHFIVESLVKTGVTIRPIDEHYASDSVREALFVVRDPSRQAAVDAAADAFFARALAAIEAGEPLRYDFSMTSSRGLAGAVGDEAPLPRGFYCSGVGDWVFAQAGVELFPYRSHLRPGAGSAALFRAWGIDPTRPVPAPGDADVSPVLRRVAEGCVVDEGLRASHIGHVVLAEVFRWMDEEGFRLRAPWWYRFGTAVAATLNDTKLDVGLIPSGMSLGVLRTFVPLVKTGDALGERLVAEDLAFRRSHDGRPMTPVELRRALRRLRDAVDLASWFVRVEAE